MSQPLMDCYMLDSPSAYPPCSKPWCLDDNAQQAVDSPLEGRQPSSAQAASDSDMLCYAQELEQEVAQLEAAAHRDSNETFCTTDTYLSSDTGLFCNGSSYAPFGDESADSDDPEVEDADVEVVGLDSRTIRANADSVGAGDGCLRPGAWRGCMKSPWCGREDRHRGLCNRKATVPGPAALAASAPRARAPSCQEPLSAAAAWQEPALGRSADCCLNQQPAELAADTSEQVSAGHHSHNLKSSASMDEHEVASALKTAPSVADSTAEADDDAAGLQPLPLMASMPDPLDDSTPGPFCWAKTTPEERPTSTPLGLEGMYHLQRQLELEREQQQQLMEGGSAADGVQEQLAGSEVATGVASCQGSPVRDQPPVVSVPLPTATLVQKPLGPTVLLLPSSALASMASSTRPSRPDGLPLVLTIKAEALAVTPVAATPAAVVPALQVPATASMAPAVPVASAVTPAATSSQPPQAAAEGTTLCTASSAALQAGSAAGRMLRPASARAPKHALEAALEEAGPSRKRTAHRFASAPSGHCCSQCGTQTTPVWRAGPAGPKTLCNACGVRFMKIAKRKM